MTDTTTSARTKVSDEALDTLVDLGVTRVLTSGGAPTAAEGVTVIADLVARAGEDLVVMAGGSVRSHNVADIVSLTKVREVHARVTAAADVRSMRDAMQPKPTAWWR